MVTLKKTYLNIIFTLTLFLTIFSVGFNFYLNHKIKYYIAHSNELSQKYNSLQLKLDNTLEELNFFVDVKKISSIIEQFAKNYRKYTITDIAYTIVEESYKNNLDPYLMLAIIKTESSFKYKIVSRKGAIGLMQLLPNTAYYISEKIDDLDVESKKEIFDPLTNIKLGINYYSYLLKKFNGDESLAIVAYNYGPKNIYKFLAYGKEIPKFYYYKVMENYKELNLQISS